MAEGGGTNGKQQQINTLQNFLGALDDRTNRFMEESRSDRLALLRDIQNVVVDTLKREERFMTAEECTKVHMATAAEIGEIKQAQRQILANQDALRDQIREWRGGLKTLMWVVGLLAPFVLTELGLIIWHIAGAGTP